jgi:hypothetical protein
MSPYSIAIEQTARLIEQRARYFRNQVVAVVLVGVLTLVWAVVTRSFFPLALLLVLLPVSAAFFVADGRLVARWRSDVLAAWAERNIDLAAFRAAIRAYPALPRETTEGMLATLPFAEDVVTEHRVLAPTRQAVAAASRAKYHKRWDALVLKAVASGIIVSILLSALWMRSWMPLVGLAILLVGPILAAWLPRRRTVAWEAELAVCRRQAGFSEADYAGLVASLR